MVVVNALQDAVDASGSVPLCFAQAGTYANLGDALSPVMVSLLSGLPCSHKAQASDQVRMGAVGTVAHGFKGGEVWIWGTGTSKYTNPLAKGVEKLPFIAQDAARFRVAATRGPVTRRILGEENAVGAAAFGDPVWLLPDFYRPALPKRWKLGVIVHLADLNDRSFDAAVKEAYLRYGIPPEMQGSVRLINTVTKITTEALRARLDDILECERLVSTSLHGMVFAESYGIPCLYFSPRGRANGLATIDLMDEDSVDLRIIDLYRGLGRSTLKVYVQDRKQPTDWAHLIKTIDTVWEPVSFDTGPLVDAFPLRLAPLVAPAGKTIFDHPLIETAPISRFSAIQPKQLRALGGALVDRMRLWVAPR